MTTRLKISQQDAEVPTAWCGRGHYSGISVRHFAERDDILNIRSVFDNMYYRLWEKRYSENVCLVSPLYICTTCTCRTYRPSVPGTYSQYTRTYPSIPYHHDHTTCSFGSYLCGFFVDSRPHAICYDREYSTRPVRSTYVNYSCICCIHAEARNESVI